MRFYCISYMQGGILKSRVDIVITGHKNSLKRVSALRLKNNIANIYIYIYII